MPIERPVPVDVGNSAIVGSVSFLLSPNAAAINGHNLIIDDGWTL